MAHYSFDDDYIGRKPEVGRKLATQDIPRPIGMTRQVWYAHAAKVCERLNLTYSQNLRADKADLETANAIMDAHVDITGAELVQVSARNDGSVLWVNVNGVCALRVSRIPKGALQIGHES